MVIWALESLKSIQALVAHTWEANLSLKSASEHFQQTLISQYRELIAEAILESETDHKTRLDLGKLNFKLKAICKAAQCDGLNEAIMDRLIDEAIPKVQSEVDHAA